MKPLHLLALLLCCLAPLLHAQSGLTRLGEFKVNTTTSGDQTDPRMAADAAGNFIVVWTSADSSGTGIFAQRYNAACSPVGGEFAVNRTNVANNQRYPSVSMAPDGRFVVVWEADDAGGAGVAIMGQLYAADGTPQFANDFSVGGTIPSAPSVAMDSAGRFTVAWTDESGGNVRVLARQFSAAGTPVRGVFQAGMSHGGGFFGPAVATNSTGDFVIAFTAVVAEGQTVYTRGYFLDGTVKFLDTNRVSGPVETAAYEAPEVVMRSDGSFVVTWNDASGIDGSGYGIWCRRFDASGNALDASKVPVNTATSGNQSAPRISMGPSGEFVISYPSAGFDGNSDAVAVQRFDANGAKVGNEFFANTFTAGNQNFSTSAIDAQGNLLFVWRSAGQDGSGQGVYADKYYLPNQGPPLSEFRVNTTTAGEQKNPAVAMNGSGHAVVVWEAPDGSSSGVVAQRYDTDGRRVGAEIQVNPFTTGEQSQPAVVIDSTGKFAVVWKSVGEDGGNDAIYVRRFLADGTADPAAPSPVKANSTASPSGSGGFLTAPNIAMSSTGRIVVTWVGPGFSAYQVFTESGTPDGGEKILNGTNVASCAFTPAGGFALAWTFNPQQNVMESRMHFYDQSGNPTGDEILLSTVGDPTQHPVLKFGSDGKGVAVWRRLNPAPTLGDLEGRLVDANGTLGPILPPINTSLNGEQSPANIAFQPGGSFLVSYISESFDGNGTGIALQRFNAAGVKQGPELVVNTERTGDQGGGSYNRLISTDGLGNYFVVWHSPNQDGSGFGVYATKVFVSEAPTVTTLAATGVGATKATLRATIDPNGQTATMAFEYDDDPGFGSPGLVQVPGSFSGINPLDAEVQVVQGLLKGVTYSFRAKATVGTQVILGNTLDFTTANAAPVAKADTFYVTGQDQTLDVLVNDADPDLPGDLLTLSGALPQPSFMAEDGSTVVAGTLQKITLGSREAFSFTATNTFTDRAGFDYAVADADGLTSTAAVQLFRFTALRGIYSGLVTDTSGVEPDGVLKLTVNAVAGRFTGVLFWGGGSFPVDSFFAADGSVTLGVAGTALQFTLRVTDPMEGTIAGTLTDNTVPSQPVTAAISLLREDDGGGDDSTSPTPGNYTTFIDEPQIIDPGAGAAAAAEPRGDVSNSPTGTGFSFAKIGTKKQKRRGRFATSLADGSKFTAGSGLAGRSYTLAQALYQIKKGQFGGSFNSQPTFPSGNNSRFESGASWTRSAIPGIPGSEFFPGGFRLKLTLAGVPYDGRRASPINFPENGGNNAKITFKGGGLDTDLSFFVKVDRRNRVESGSPNLVVRMNKVAGTFSGSFVHPDETTRVKFIGLFQQNSAAAPAVEQGLGYFRALGLRRTGRVVMKAN